MVQEPANIDATPTSPLTQVADAVERNNSPNPNTSPENPNLLSQSPNNSPQNPNSESTRMIESQILSPHRIVIPSSEYNMDSFFSSPQAENQETSDTNAAKSSTDEEPDFD